MTIALHLQKVFQRIDDSVNLSNNNSHPVTLLAVSKTHKINKIREAFEAGQRDFGESYIQEAVEKIIALSDLDICWYFIGPIQSNKTQKIAKYFDWTLSVDRLKIAKRLSAQRPESKRPLNICLQVNISEEDSKSGVLPTDLLELVEQIDQLPRLKLRGLMCIPAKTDDVKQQAQAFHQMQKLFTLLKSQYPDLDTLSMGMSADFDAAIAQGSTMIRVGTDIFGKRN
ncbi:MAG: YggS family pyridoxal phosphate-dependent enzyme [Gammaproteobacteria bacterium]|nr:MAG: YggS family pyridoxal phosphate-dependent enzyme [Gammaproteobacteria bacterium]